MPTYQHELPLRLLQENPKFAEELYCGVLGQRLPEHTSVRSGSEAMTRGEARGEAKAILRILTFRKVAIDVLSRSRIESCLDTEQLERRLGNAMTAERIEDLFK